MEDEQGLIEKARRFGSRIAASAKNNENILIATHHDADGICSAAIIAEFVYRNKGHCQIRSVSEPNSRFLDRLDSNRFDLFVFLDTCSGLSSEISKRFGDKWLIIDHHEISDEEAKSERILNCWQFGYDGTVAVSSAGLCYYATRPSEENIGFLATVGALGDRQDTGPRRSIVGLNAKILEEDTSNSKSIESKFDLLLFSRETKPIHESLANTLTFFIPGLTGNKDACLATLRGAGVEIKSSTRWKSVSDFSEEEKQKLLEAITPHLSGTTYTVEDLVGSVYSLNAKDEYSVMRDARDVAAILSACGRMGRPSIGLSICLDGDSEIVNEIEQIYSDYRSEIGKTLQSLSSSEDRIAEKGEYALITGDGLVNERLTGAVAQVLASYSRFRNKVVVLRTTTVDGDVKISARAGKERRDFNLGQLMAEVASATSGIGGGHKDAAGGRFSIAKQQEFLQAVDLAFQKRRQS